MYVLKKWFFNVCVCMCVYVYGVHAGACGGQQRALDPPDQELQAGESRVGAGNQTQALCKSRKPSNVLSISPGLTHLYTLCSIEYKKQILWFECINFP